jgi:hypothetical protein
MSTQVQFRRGTTTQNNAFTGAAGEITYDTDVKTLRLHDGTTAGGGAIVLNNVSSQTALNKTFSTGSVWNGNAVGLAYGGTGSALTATAGAVPYSTSSGLGLSAAGTSGQVLTSGGTNSPVWVNASSLTTGTATTATTATNIAGGSAGQLVIQSDTNLSTFITAGASGTFLQSAGAGYAPTWAAGQVILGSTAVALGATVTTFSGLTNLIMGNGSFGNGTISGPGITGSGPWTVTVTGITSTTGLSAGQQIIATAGTGSLYNSPTSVVIASVVNSTSITVTVTGGTTPTAGTITGITVLGYLQVPVGTNAQRSWTPATGMVRYNSDTVSFEGYSSGAWSSLGGVSSVDKYTYIRAETSAGASNGELEFFVKNSGGNAAVKAMGITNTGVTIVGNLTVNGTTTTVNTETVVTQINTSDIEDTIRSLKTFTGTTSGTGATAITTFDKTVHRGGTIEMLVTNSTAYRVLRLMFVHDGTNVTLSDNYLTGVEIQTGATNTTFTASISSNTLTIYATCSSGTAVIKGEALAFKI